MSSGFDASGAPGTPNPMKAPFFFSGNVPSTRNYGIVNMGPGPWDGISPGHYNGEDNGVVFALNAPTDYTGKLVSVETGGKTIWEMHYNDFHIGVLNSSTFPTFMWFQGATYFVDTQGNIDDQDATVEIRQAKALTADQPAQALWVRRNAPLGGFNYTYPLVTLQNQTASIVSNLLEYLNAGGPVATINNDGVHNLNFTPAGHFSGVAIPIKAGAFADTDYQTPIDGLVGYDSTANKLNIRVGGVWKVSGVFA